MLFFFVNFDHFKCLCTVPTAGPGPITHGAWALCIRQWAPPPGVVELQYSWFKWVFWVARCSFNYGRGSCLLWESMPGAGCSQQHCSWDHTEVAIHAPLVHKWTEIIKQAAKMGWRTEGEIRRRVQSFKKESEQSRCFSQMEPVGWILCLSAPGSRRETVSLLVWNPDKWFCIKCIGDTRAI